jgi:indolepyruvate ferredoxin oxidoreductase
MPKHGPVVANAETPEPLRTLLSGTDAVVHLLREQRRRDRAAGMRTAGFVSGYRGSPLGTLDMALWAAAEQLKQDDIHFLPGINEDLAATALWGAQYVGQVAGGFPGARVDGVFGLWYGKGPGVDRSGDALKHGNRAGTSPLGGALVLAGDDHAAKSSTTAHQSEQALVAAGIPVLVPCDVKDIVHLGLHGLALSRTSGCWVGLKVVTDVVESTMSVSVAALGPTAPPSPGTPERAIRVQDRPQLAEQRLMADKLPAVLAYARANGLNRTVIAPDAARYGLIAAGKSYADVREALALLGLDDAACARLGLRVMKLDMVWPLDPQQIAGFARRLQSILVVEEKRALIEDQVKALLYDLDDGAPRPRIVGKRAASAALGGAGEAWLPDFGELDPLRVARAIARWLALDDAMLPTPAAAALASAVRLPSFCSGCPHSISTRLPDGSRALAGIGCHGMATIRQVGGPTTTMSQMGGEGVMWLGQAPFTDEPHVFANLGDGTYFHSGVLAVRAAVAAKVNITYKLLVNGFVSMTGGQRIDGDLSVPDLVRELQAEGVAQVEIVTDEPGQFEGANLPAGVPVHDRHDLDAVQRRLREVKGVSAIVYVQPCATERRRLRKRGDWPDPAVRTFIHPMVCEGCGDCGAASDCLSIEPLETPFGRKRRINQSSCNKDRSCVDGFCPSFVTVHGGRFKGTALAAEPRAAANVGRDDTIDLPEPAVAPVAAGYDVLVAGVGGTGVVTATAVLARAAHDAGLAVSVLDVTGLSQKYGGVQSHLRFLGDGAAVLASRIPPAGARLLIGCDLLVAAEPDVQARLRPAVATAVLNTALSPSADFTRQPDWQVDRDATRTAIEASCVATVAADATALAERHLGDAIGANLILLGMACQRGWLPVPAAIIERAIGGMAGAKGNLKAFRIGRQVVADPDWAQRSIAPAAQAIQLVPRQPRDLEAWLALHQEQLTAYQNWTLADRHGQRIRRLATAERAAGFAKEALATAAARGYFKLLAHKDEFEVARLLSDPAFRSGLSQQFEGPVRLHAHLGGGPLERKDASGRPLKTELSGWVWPALRVMARLRVLRGSWLDPWRHNGERRLAQACLAQYEHDLDRIEAELAKPVTERRHALLVRLAALPDRLRGYGHVRARHATQVREERGRILGELDAATASVVEAA